MIEKHMSKSNRWRWSYNKHKKPFFFTSEVNNAIRNKRNDIDKFIAFLIWDECFVNRYTFKNHRHRGIIK